MVIGFAGIPEDPDRTIGEAVLTVENRDEVDPFTKVGSTVITDRLDKAIEEADLGEIVRSAE